MNVQNFRLKCKTVAKKTVKNFRGLLYFVAPRICTNDRETQRQMDRQTYKQTKEHKGVFYEPVQKSMPLQLMLLVNSRSVSFCETFDSSACSSNWQQTHTHTQNMLTLFYWH